MIVWADQLVSIVTGVSSISKRFVAYNRTYAQCQSPDKIENNKLFTHSILLKKIY